MATIHVTPLLPTRVIDVGSTNGPEEPFLYESKGEKGQYLTLSHRWGNPNIITTTTTSVVDQHNKCIQLQSLCQTFQDAICFTRKLGFRYIWIDSLCIIQDSPEDWELEASRMADVYRNSTLTLSASISTSGEDGLFYPRISSNSVSLPVLTPSGIPVGSYSITDRVLSNFEDDIEKGTLAKRAWCLQERVLSPRILHFGRDQLHWECSSGCWSENNVKKLTGSNGGIEAELRQLFSSSEWPELAALFRQLRVDKNSRPRQIYNRGHYGKWYWMLRAYSRREMTNEEDKLPALAGIAKLFQQFSGDRYVAGLWVEDLPAGLLWSGANFFAPYGSPSPSRRPSKRRAPSWSWASYDGPIDYPLAKLGDIDIQRNWVTAMVKGSSPDELGRIETGYIELTGRLRILGDMFGFSPPHLEYYKHNAQYHLQNRIPRAEYDEPGLYSNTEVVCLLIAFEGCGSKTCSHFAGCEQGFAYGLLLQEDKDEGGFRRVGVALTYQSDWDGVGRERIVLK
jgi:hypothetical protein